MCLSQSSDDDVPIRSVRQRTGYNVISDSDSDSNLFDPNQKIIQGQIDELEQSYQDAVHDQDTTFDDGDEEDEDEDNDNDQMAAKHICTRHQCVEGNTKKSGEKITFTPKEDGTFFKKCDQCREVNRTVYNPVTNKVRIEASKTGDRCFDCSAKTGLEKVGEYHYCSTHVTKREDKSKEANEREKELRKKVLHDIITKGGDIQETEMTDIEVETRLKTKIIPLIDSSIKSEKFFTIGLSALHNVKNRTSQYYPLRDDGWNKGYIELDVVYNPLNLKALESAAIRHYQNSPFLCNDNDGGGGLINLEHGSWVLYLKTADRKPDLHYYATKGQDWKEDQKEKKKNRQAKRLL